MQNKLTALIIALLTASAFLWAILTPPSFFNKIPHWLYTTAGLGDYSEYSFTNIFDVAFAVLLFFLLYKAVFKLITG